MMREFDSEFDLTRIVSNKTRSKYWIFKEFRSSTCIYDLLSMLKNDSLLFSEGGNYNSGSRPVFEHLKKIDIQVETPIPFTWKGELLTHAGQIGKKALKSV